MIPTWPALIAIAAYGAGAGFGLAIATLFWRALRAAPVDWTGLIVDEATGKASHSKLGVHGFNVVALVLLARICWNSSPGDGVATMLLTVGGLFGVSQIASKAIGAKVFGGASPAGTTSTTETRTTSSVTAPAPIAESKGNGNGKDVKS